MPIRLWKRGVRFARRHLAATLWPCGGNRSEPNRASENYCVKIHVSRVDRDFLGEISADRGSPVPPLVIAHRGASAKYPDNTVLAFQQAGALGADWIEFDVRTTADDALVVCHDPVVSGREIAATRAADLPASVPSLLAALEACEGLGVNIEVKNHPAERSYRSPMAVAQRLQRELAGWKGSAGAQVSCFDLATLDALAETCGLPSGWLIAAPLGLDGAIVEACRHGHRAINPSDALVTAALVAKAHDAGLGVYVWTVDDPRRQRALASFGVDGIITNAPDVARAALS